MTTRLSDEEKTSAQVLLPAGYSESDYEMSDEEIAFEQFRDEAKDSENYSKIAVSRVPLNKHGQRGAQKLVFLFECSTDDYTYTQLLSKIRDEYGSGAYKIQARNERGQLKLNKTVTVEAPRHETPTASADNGNGNVISQVAQILEEQREQISAMLERSQPTMNQMGSMKELFETMGAAMKMFGVTKSEPKTLVETLTEFKMIKELLGGDSDHDATEANLFTLLTESVKTLGGPIAAAITAAAKTGAVDSNGVATNPRALNAPEKPVDETNKKADETMKSQINILLANANAGVDPVQFASLVLDNTPEEQEDALYSFISSENFFDTIVKLVPEAAPKKDWFLKLRDTLLEAMTEPDDEDLQADSNESTVPREAVAGDATGNPVKADASNDAHDGDATGNS